METVSSALAKYTFRQCAVCAGAAGVISFQQRRSRFMDLHCGGCGNFTVHEELRGRFLFEDPDQRYKPPAAEVF